VVERRRFLWRCGKWSGITKSVKTFAHPEMQKVPTTVRRGARGVRAQRKRRRPRIGGRLELMRGAIGR